VRPFCQKYDNLRRYKTKNKRKCIVGNHILDMLLITDRISRLVIRFRHLNLLRLD